MTLSSSVDVKGEENRENIRMEKRPEKEGGEKREGTRSRSSSTSSEDYIIILPDCFDTSRPLGESMYRWVTPRGGYMQRSRSHEENYNHTFRHCKWVLL